MRADAVTVDAAWAEEAAATVDAVRQLMVAVATTAVDEDDLARARELVEQARELLARSARDLGVRVHLDREAIARVRAGEPWRVFRHNPLGIPLVIRVRDQEAMATVIPNALLEGPPRLLHGGFSAAMMDALISTLVQAQDLRAVTVRLDVELLAAVPLDVPLELSARLVSVDGRKVSAVGSISRHGAEAVRAQALLVTVPGEPD